MRQIALDTETTGLSPTDGHRIIEIGCIEMINRRITGNHFHCYINPDRDIDSGAVAVHGITSSFLQDKPKFHHVLDSLLAFISGAELVIHNAPFDVGFLNAEFKLAGSVKNLEECCSVFDTLLLARQKHPGQKNSLDALCKRYNVDNSHRQLHGALLDAELLAKIYLIMTGGQGSLFMEGNTANISQLQVENSVKQVTRFKNLPITALTTDEQQAHAEFLELIRETSGEVMWEET